MYKNYYSKTNNSIRNTIWGIDLKILTLLFPFITRTLLIRLLGAEYLGLNSLFTSLLNILSLSELGIGGAMIYYMYAPFVREDYKTINSLLSLYRKIYHYIGLAITILGLLLFPFLGFFICGDTPTDINLQVLYLIYLFNSSISYFLFSYRRSLFIANQRSDIESKSLIIANIIMYFGQLLGIIFFHDYYIYAIAIPVATILNNIFVYYLSRKFYPEIKCQGLLDKTIISDIVRKVKALFGHKVGGVITTSIPNIVISSFLGLTTLAIFNNYYYVILLLGGFIDIFFNSIRASIGYNIIQNSIAKNLDDFKFLQFCNCWCISIFSLCFIFLIQPFMLIWVGRSLMCDQATIILFTLLFYIWNIRKVCLVYKDAAGNWEKDRLKPYVETFLNIFFSILLAKIFGVKGVIISSIFCMLIIDIPWELYALNKVTFKTSWSNLIKIPAIGFVLFLALIIIFISISSYFKGTSIYSYVIRTSLFFILPNILFILIFWKSVYVKRILSIIQKK